MVLDSQDVSNILNSILAITTVWLGFAAHSTAKATRQSVEIQSQPHFSIDGMLLNVGNAANLENAAISGFTRIALLISNPGQVLVNYEIEEFKVSFKNLKIDNPNLLTKRNLIHPKANSKYYYPAIVQSNQLSVGSGDISIKIAYWSTLHTVYHVTALIRYELQNVETGYYEWIFAEGPVYS